MQQNWSSLFLVLLAILLITPNLHSQTNFDGLSLQADSGERDLAQRTMSLQGHVQIVFKGQHLSADRVIIYQDRKELTAEGHVLLVTPKATLGGDKIVMNYDKNTGLFYSGFIQSGQVIFEGSVIEKKGEDEYFAVESEYTSCTTCPAAWSFKGHSIDAELGGYAIIKNSFLQFGRVPVLWLPYLIVPLKSERQTGLLTPSFEYSQRGGLSVSQPFFWAISKSQDATLTFQSYALRGMKGLLNHRYLLSKESSGELDAGYIRDNYFGQSNRYENYLTPAEKINRWFLRYRQYWVLPENWILRASINNASDLQYPADFPFETLNHGEPAMENRISLTQNDVDRHFSIDSTYYINLLKGNPKADNTDSVHRLPEINYISKRMPLGDSGFLYSYDLRYTHFSRNDFAYDDLINGTDANGSPSRQVAHQCSTGGSMSDSSWEQDATCKPVRDGQFNEGTDLIRSGQRLILEPSLTRPTRLGDFFDLVPKLSYRESHYRFGIDGVENLTRRFLRTELKLQTAFSRIFGDTTDPYSTRIKHEFQPEVISTAVPWLNEPNHPFLGFSKTSEVPFYSRDAASDLDLFGDNGLQFDYEDRLFDRNLITYRLTNKITRKTWSPFQSANYDRIMTWRISQTYDVHEAQTVKNGKPWSDIESILSMRLAHFNTYTKINFFPYQGITDTSSNVTVNDDDGNYLRLGLTRKYALSAAGEIDANQRVEDYLFQVGTTARYINFAGRLIYNGNSEQSFIDRTRIKALTYAVILRPPGNCWGIHFVQHQDIANDDVTYRLNFDFSFDGKAPTLSPTKLLEGYGF